jgi:DNA-binding FrmR family transcriptional regulator
MANNIKYCVKISTLIEAVTANALRASYVLVQNDTAKEIQSTAENYLFDTKVLVQIKDETQMTPLIKEGIDGVIYADSSIVSVSGGK